jgi:predicted anti-sigma-YlaC factor YlaD
LIPLAKRMHRISGAQLSSSGTGGTGKMTCRDTIHLICWYLEGKLSVSVETEIEKHLGSCSDCRLVLDAATTTLERYFSPERVATEEAASRAA